MLLVRSEPPEFSPDLGAAFYQSLYFASPPTNPLCFRWTKALSLALSLFYFLCNLLTSNMFTILKSYPHSPKPQNQISIWKSNRHSTTKLFTFLSLPLPPETHDLHPQLVSFSLLLASIHQQILLPLCTTYIQNSITSSFSFV